METGADIMAKEAVDKILSAENEGDRIRSEAGLKAKQCLEDAKSVAEEIINSEREKALVEAERILAEARSKADEILKAASEDKDPEYEKLEALIKSGFKEVSEGILKLL